MSFWKYIKDIPSFGVNTRDRISVQRKVRLSNYVLVLVSIVVICVGPIWLYIGEVAIAVGILSLIPVAVLMIYLNKIGRHKFSRIFLIVFNTVVAIVTTDVIGTQGGTQYYFFTIMVGIYSLFDYEEQATRITLLLLTLFSFVVLHSYDYDLITDYRVGHKAIEFLFYVNLTLAFGISVLVLGGNLRFVYDDEQQLLLRNKELSELSEDLYETREILFKNQDKLRRAKNEAEKALKIKSDFLSNMSHEIRTPMNSVIGFSELLLESGNLSKEELLYIESIKTSTNHLLVIINDILDFSKLESGKLSLESIPINLKEELQTLEYQLSLSAKQKKLRFNTSLDREICDYLIGDPVRLRQILMNLCSNAIKFTKEGSVELGAKVIWNKKNTQRIQFWVKDTGIGIPEHLHENVFESFQQGQSGTSRSYGGTGLGLAIARELTTLHGGEIWLNSKEGKGSTFYVEIPFEKSQGPEDDPSQYSVGVESIRGVRILTAEDNEMNRLLLNQFFKKWDIENDFVNNGEEAIRQSKIKKYDLILMDLQMPVMNGYDAITIIQEDETNLNAETPAVAVTADAFPETEARALSDGFLGFVSKPIDQNELKVTIKTLTKNKY